MRKLVAGGATALALLMLAPSALASSHHPTGEWEQFAECPLNRATITDCVYSVSTGGEFTVGTKTVPLTNPVILQGGFEGAGEEIEFYGAENGDTLSETPQPVPGGLTGITAPTWWPKFVQNWFNKLISEGFTGVNAIVELTGPTKGLTNINLNSENLINEEGIALGLPVKIKLENVILGNNCYIGSSSKPVQIDFSTGESGSLTGAAGTLSFNPDFSIITVSGGKLVSNTFAAPGASGCGGLFSIFVDPLVNTVLGLPSEAGENAATLEGTLKDSVASKVKASE